MSTPATRIVAALHNDSATRALADRTAFVWIDEAPPREPLPVLVLARTDTTAEAPARARGTYTQVDTQTYSLAIRAKSRPMTCSLAEAAADALVLASVTGSLDSDDGSTVDCRPSGEETERLTPDTAPDGSDVWERVLSLTVMVSRT